MARGTSTAAVVAEGAVEVEAERGAPLVWRWLRFQLAVAAAIFVLMWLSPVVPFPDWISNPLWFVTGILLPVASIVVPAARGVPRRKRKLTWHALPTGLAAMLLAGVSAAAGSSFAQDRMEWTRAEVVAVEHGKHVRCVLRKPDGQEISPDLRDDDGCKGKVGRGDVLQVKYDPKGALSPTVETGSKDGAPIGLVLPGAAVVFVGFGTWGAVRLRQKYQALYGM